MKKKKNHKLREKLHETILSEIFFAIDNNTN